MSIMFSPECNEWYDTHPNCYGCSGEDVCRGIAERAIGSAEKVLDAVKTYLEEDCSATGQKPIEIVPTQDDNQATGAPVEPGGANPGPGRTRHKTREQEENICQT